MRVSAGRRLAAIALLVAVLVAGIGTLAVAGPSPPSRAQRPPNATAVDAPARLQSLHDAGVTGAGVSVGVVDVTGFDADDPSLRGRVVAARSFAPGETVANGGRNAHGTAAASLVARTAPGADLYLASFDTADGYRRAVDWLVEQDVDVVVAPVSFYGKPGDGSSDVAAVARRAVDRGVVFVAPAGNLGRGHWRGAFRPTREGIHVFDGGTRNHLEADDHRRLTVWLSWPRAHADRDFTVELHRTNGTASRLVARSQPFAGDDVPNERIVARLDPDATYYVVVRGPADAAGVPIRVESPSHGFQFRRRAGSVVAPASAAAVVSVGAYDAANATAEPFGSAGPVDGGRVGVDVVAGDRVLAAGVPGRFVGSSAAAPRVAGVAALTLQVNPGLRPAAVEAVVRESAVDVARPGVDPVTGYGLVSPRRAVSRARNATATG